jgi:hypothetical protein
MPLPRVRPLDAYPIEIKGEMYVGIRDREGVLEEQVFLPPFVYLVLESLNGRRDVADLQAHLSKVINGQQIDEAIIRQIVEELDKHYLLDTPRYKEKRDQIERTFIDARVRPLYNCAPANLGAPHEVKQLLDGFFEKGPGSPPQPPKKPKELAGLIAPHIDYFRGGPCYAHAYKHVAESRPADLYVILGVAHASPPAPYIVSDKDFETPFGVVECDRDFVRRLCGRVTKNPMRYQLVHRTEHSIEFQAVYLKHVLSEPFKIVPILCSHFEPFCGSGSPSKNDDIEMFILALMDTIEETPGRVCIVSGADLAHVGKRFGDSFDIDESIIEWVKKDDQLSLELAVQGDADGFYASVMADGDKRKVCGLSSIYTTVRLMGKKRQGRLLDYGYAPDPAGGIVSFASVIYPAAAENGRKSR